MNISISTSTIAIALLGLLGSGLTVAHPDRYTAANHSQVQRHYGFDNRHHPYRYQASKHHHTKHHQAYRQNHRDFDTAAVFLIKPFAFYLYDRNRNYYPSRREHSSHRHEAHPRSGHHHKHEQREHHQQRQQYVQRP